MLEQTQQLHLQVLAHTTHLHTEPQSPLAFIVSNCIVLKSYLRLRVARWQIQVQDLEVLQDALHGGGSHLGDDGHGAHARNQVGAVSQRQTTFLNIT